MRICFNEATAMKRSTLEQDLNLCEKHGYELIEIRLDKLKEYLQTHTMEDLVSFFHNSRLKPYAFNSLEYITFRDDAGYRQIKQDLQFLCEVGERIDCKKIVVVPTFDVKDHTREQIKEETVRVLHELAEMAEPYGVSLAFEFIGDPNCTVNTFGQAYEIIQEVNRSNVGMVLDCFHFHAMGSSLEDLKKADPTKILIFHIDDAEDLPIGMLKDHHRVWPGDGVIDFDALLTSLKEIGYKEMASVELFRPDYWEMEAEDTIRIAKEKTEAVVGRFFEID
jgi:2-keto-myo-inositol isomerase